MKSYKAAKLSVPQKELLRALARRVPTGDGHYERRTLEALERKKLVTWEAIGISSRYCLTDAGRREAGRLGYAL